MLTFIWDVGFFTGFPYLISDCFIANRVSIFISKDIAVGIIYILVLEADKTEDNLNAYNSLVRKWNESFSQYGTLEELSQDAIKKADSATVATEESVGAAAEYARTSSNRFAQQEAAEKG